jgi:peptidoglycan/xylan/chitin deacetylase (PgdA/CDA1 family)
LIELHEEGFEIGNHTMGHPPVTKCSDQQLHEEIEGVEKLLTDIGLPRPVTFAYPNGVYSEDAVKVLRERGYLAARTCEPRATEPGVDSPFAIPAYSVSIGNGMDMFDKALATLTPDRPVALLYHGLPSVHYPPCGIEPEDFEAQMEVLDRENIRCITMKQFIEEW